MRPGKRRSPLTDETTKVTVAGLPADRNLGRPSPLQQTDEDVLEAALNAAGLTLLGCHLLRHHPLAE